MKVLGIETSCDETAASVVEIDSENTLTLHSNVIASSVDLHIAFGGVVPEIAARSHIEHIMPVIDKALSDAFPGDTKSWDQIDAIAVTYGPGLGGSLLVGVVTARTLALIKKKPLYAVNHVAAHAIAPFITKKSSRDALNAISLPTTQPSFPMLALIVSGGHSQLVLFRSVFDYEILGRTQDDAVGEAFDKVAKIIGLPYPGGPSVEKKAKHGDFKRFNFPVAKLENPYDFSFSGLKTAVLRTAQAEIGKDHTFPSSGVAEQLGETQKADIAASFQDTAVKTLVDKTYIAFTALSPSSVVIAGGVAASPELRRQLKEKLPIEPIYTDMKLCTDNGAMIAALGCFMHAENLPQVDPYTLEISPSLSM